MAAGDTYRVSLKDLPPALQAKWIRGEWGAVEGCYFTIWNPRRYGIQMPSQLWSLNRARHTRKHVAGMGAYQSDYANHQD